MRPRLFHFRPFLRQVYGTEPFMEYCKRRGIDFEQMAGWLMHKEDECRWEQTLAALSEPLQTQIDLELAQVHELAHEQAIMALRAAAQERETPEDTIPTDAAVALWYLLYHPDLFFSVFVRQEMAMVDCWRVAQVKPGIDWLDLASHADALGSSLRDFFRTEGTGRFCAVEAYRLGDSMCFVAHLSDRLRRMEIFTERGQHTARVSRPAFPVVFLYQPHDGRILLKTRCRAPGRILDLFQRFGKTVLGIDLDQRSLEPLFRLNGFKHRFDPPLDGPDLDVRVKALTLAYPERLGRRRVTLETLAGDSQFAILDLLEDHCGREGSLEQLDVIYVELEVTIENGRRYQQCPIRLWPDRCNLQQTELGQRLRACFQRWGIAHAPQP